MEYLTPTSQSNLGVKIQDINLAKDLSKQDIASIRELWINYGIAIFPNQNLTLKEYENFSLKFGSFS